MFDHSFPTAPRHCVPWRLAIALFLAFSVLFIVLRSANYNGDMVWQSCVAAGLSPVEYEPDHLFYQPLVRGIWLLWQNVGLPGEAHVALQTVNAFFGGLMVATMFLIVNRITGRAVLSLLAAAFWGFTPYVWHHATDVETYGSTKALQLVAVYLILLLVEGGDMKRRCTLAVLIAVVHALATFIQYRHAMLVPAAIAAALFPNIEESSDSWSARIGVATVYLFTVGVLVWGPFIYIAYAVESVDGVTGFKEWLLSPNYGWPAFARTGWLKTPLKFIAGWANWPVAESLELPMHEAKRVLLGDIPLQVYLGQYWPRYVFVGVIGLIQLALLVKLITSFSTFTTYWRRVVLVAFAIIAPYQLFGLYWGGAFMDFALPAYFLLLVLAYVEAARTKESSRLSRLVAGTTPLLCGLAATANLFLSYVPEHDPRTNKPLQETLAVAQEVEPEDLIVTPGGCLTSEYWIYFTPDVRVHFLRPGRHSDDPLAVMLNRVDKSIDNTLSAGGDVYLHRIFADEDEVTRPWNEFLFFGIRRADVLEHFRAYEREEAFRYGDSVYWRLLPPSDRS